MKKLLTVLLAFVMLFSIGASAITLDTAENAAEVTEETAELSAEINLDTDKLHPSYGTLIYYNDFEGYSSRIGENIESKTADSGGWYITGGNSVVFDGDSGADVVAITAPYGDDATNTALQMTHTTGKWPQIYIQLGARTEYTTGKYHVVYDIYVPEGKTAKNLVTWFQNNLQTVYGLPLLPMQPVHQRLSITSQLISTERVLMIQTASILTTSKYTLKNM